ncbi:hypothetical protein IFM89_019701 [Coptis chinensis]|uniref:Uncharacterized protein n=1 Tax=Coptis chinensis TaxID=261450 RepID=A0A835LE71_9MAGN|nr:hypothetical protein IFM89_019701 [Coptis chinensis]
MEKVDTEEEIESFTLKLKLMNIVIVNMVKVTSDHHEEVIKVGISPSLKESESFQKFLYVIAGYLGDVRLDDSVWLFEDVYVWDVTLYNAIIIRCTRK